MGRLDRPTFRPMPSPAAVNVTRSNGRRAEAAAIIAERAADLIERVATHAPVLRQG